jgi:hypothetical protein
LHAGEDVLVDLHGECDAGVAEAFADDFDRHAGFEEESESAPKCPPDEVVMVTERRIQNPLN